MKTSNNEVAFDFYGRRILYWSAPVLILLYILSSCCTAYGQATTFKNFENMAFSTTTAQRDDDDLSLAVQTGDGALFPSSNFYVVLFEDIEVAYEIVLCSSRSVDAFTIVRAQQDTLALTWPANTNVQLVWTKADIETIQDAINDIEDGTTTLEALNVSGASTLDGGLTMDTNKVVIADTSGNADFAGYLKVAGDFEPNGGLSLSTGAATIDGTTGAIATTGSVGGGSLTITGAAALNGGITVDSTAFQVANTSGDTTITTGTLTVGGLSYFNGGINCDTGKFTVADGDGDTYIDGTLEVNSTLTVTQNIYPETLISNDREWLYSYEDTVNDYQWRMRTRQSPERLDFQVWDTASPQVFQHTAFWLASTSPYGCGFGANLAVAGDCDFNGDVDIAGATLFRDDLEVVNESDFVFTDGTNTLLSIEDDGSTGRLVLTGTDVEIQTAGIIIEDSDANALMTIDDDNDEGDVGVTGDLEVVGTFNAGSINQSSEGSGSFILRTVTDSAMTITAGSTGELVFETTNSKVYVCTSGGTPGTWAALN